MVFGKAIGPGRLSAGVALLGVVLVGVTGCGSGSPFDMVKVDGKVTYEDGSLIKAAKIEILFTPQQDSVKPVDGASPRPGTAVVDVADGTFSEVISPNGEGLVVGKHNAIVFIYKDEGAVPLDVSPTPAEIEVGSGETHFEFKIKKQ
jgi:hypothetical protein